MSHTFIYPQNRKNAWE